MLGDFTFLLGCSEPKLKALLESEGEKAFRARQVMQWVHQRGCSDFGAMTDIAKRLMDFGFHAPTMSWPVPGTLMIEP
ncbi:MAG: hypothetical protein EBW71_04755, partial [Betaproteobacteria bacterium]|nr:hypothetical protein [Betaproteobacteria bacterium]